MPFSNSNSRFVEFPSVAEGPVELAKWLQRQRITRRAQRRVVEASVDDSRLSSVSWISLSSTARRSRSDLMAKAGLGKQAKTLSDAQVRTLVHFVAADTSHSERNRVIVLLSFKAGLRAKEIASLRWQMVTDPEGNVDAALALPNAASKGRSGRVVPLHAELRAALVSLLGREQANGRGTPDDYVVQFAKGSSEPLARSNSVQFLFRDWFRRLGFAGASSHSGRRTFITKAARVVSQVGGSLRDVQALAGHASIAVTQRYVDCDENAQRKLVDRL